MGTTRKRYLQLIHHFIAAFMLAAMMQALEVGHALEWLDGAMLRISAGRLSPSNQTDSDPDRSYRPAIVEIDQSVFQAVFEERSPLDRDKLAQLIEQIPMSPGMTLAVDIDLAPATYERSQPRALDQVFGRLTRSGVHVVLVLPDPTPDNRHLNWIKARCNDGIHFASPLLIERMGALTRVDLNTPTLAAVAHELSAQPGAARPGQDHSEHPATLPHHVCDSIARGLTEAAAYEEATSPERSEHRETVPLHPAAAILRFLAPTVAAASLANGHVSIEPIAARRNVVFLGGSYDIHDVLQTASGSLPGLYAHAAAFTSLGSQTRDMHRLRIFAIDIALGLVLGYVFSALWRRYGAYALLEQVARNSILTRLDACGERMIKPARKQVDLAQRRILYRFIVARIALSSVWTVPVVLTVLLVYLSRTLLLNGTWINPGPIVIGMFLHSMALRHEPLQHGNAHASTSNASCQHKGPLRLRISDVLREHPATLLIQLPAAIVFCVVGFFF